MTDRRLILKGSKEPLQPLIEQARYHIGLAEKHAAALADNNWLPEQTADFKAELAALDTEHQRVLEERSGARGATRAEAAAISEAKAIINRIRNVARIVVRKHPEAQVSPDEFDAGGPLGRVAGRISAYLTRLQVPVGKLESQFAPFFKNQPVTKLLEEARSRLDAASTFQELDIAALPTDTAALYLRKGKILEHIEDLNAIARSAFADDNQLRAQFNKAILNRGRLKKDPAPSPTPS